MKLTLLHALYACAPLAILACSAAANDGSDSSHQAVSNVDDAGAIANPLVQTTDEAPAFDETTWDAVGCIPSGTTVVRVDATSDPPAKPDDGGAFSPGGARLVRLLADATCGGATLSAGRRVWVDAADLETAPCE